MAKKIFLIALAVVLVVIVAIPFTESNEIYFEKVRLAYTPAPDVTPEPERPEPTPPPSFATEPEPTPEPVPEEMPDGFVLAGDVEDPYSFETLTTVEPEVTHAPVKYNALYNGINDKNGITDVRECQERLIELGYLSGKTDGGYGRNTEEAVRKFQEVNGIEATGVADNDTLTLLYSSNAKPYDASAVTAKRETLKKGSKTDDVRKLQLKLIQYGFLGGTADGIYGDDTVSAVECMEQYYIERDTAYALANPTPQPAATPVTTYRPAPTPAPKKVTGKVTPELYDRFMADEDIDTALPYTLKEGDTGVMISRLQNRLVSLGYMRVGDGQYGSATTNAMLYFQKLNGLEETGIADPETQKLIYSDTAVKSDEIVMPYYLKVDVSKQRVYIYEWDGTGFRKLIKTFICSSGKRSTPTPLGKFNEATGPLERWHYFTEFGSYGQYAWNITNGVFFHSVIYNDKNDLSSVQWGTVEALGTPASHGCIRLRVEDAKWIYEHCPAGCTVEIFGKLPK